MKKTSLASLIAMLLLLTVAAWAQTTTQAERITDGPKVSQTTANSAQVAWSTAAPGSSIVKYGSSANALNQTAQAPWGGTKESNGDYNHTVWIKDLKPNTTYYFVVVTGQGAGTGTEAQSQPQQFQTASQ
jgi:hypothetical protein